MAEIIITSEEAIKEARLALDEERAPWYVGPLLQALDALATQTINGAQYEQFQKEVAEADERLRRKLAD